MHITHRSRSATAVALAAVLALGFAGQAVANTGPDETEGLYAGKYVVDGVPINHLDLFYIGDVGSGPELVAHTDQFGNLQPEDLVLHGKPSVAERTVGAAVSTIPGFPEQGESYYLLPQTNNPGQIFAGFGYDTTVIPQGTVVTHELGDFEGPGAFAAWQSGEEGPEVWIGSDGAAPGSFTSQAEHEHLAWGFTELGEYTFTVTSTYTVAGEEAVTLEPKGFTIYIGEELPPAEDDNGDNGNGTEPDVILTISGLSDHYHAGGIVSLTVVQEPASDLDHYHWFTLEPGSSEWVVVPDAYADSYGFIATAASDGLQVKAVLYDDDHAELAESDSVTIVVDDHGNEPVEGPTISATLSDTEGALVISVAPENREVDLGEFALNGSADAYVATGELKPIQVTDTRSENPGWSASGRVRGFTTVDGDSLSGQHLGWAPTVLSSGSGQTVTPGPATESVVSGGTGIQAWSELASAPEGAGVGAAELGADLTLEAPLSLATGTYTALLILTVI